MCVLFLAKKCHPNYPLVLGLNRDEFLERATQPAHFWESHPDVMAGRDLESLGTWAGVTMLNRFAVVTNFRDPAAGKTGKTSRGLLVRQFLTSQTAPRRYVDSVSNHGANYNDFNLIVGNSKEVWFYSNRTNTHALLPDGLFALSNGTLNEPWPKVTAGKLRFAAVLAKTELVSDDIFAILRDRTIAPDSELPKTGVGLEAERALSPIFVDIPGDHAYGTRSSTVVLVDTAGKTIFQEITYQRPGNGAPPTETLRTFEF